MKIVQAKYTAGSWKYLSDKLDLTNPLVLIFGDRFLLDKAGVTDLVQKEFPYKNIVYGTAAGEIMGANVTTNELIVTAIDFERSEYIIKTSNIHDHQLDAVSLGKELIQKLPADGLKHVFVISEGSFVNGSDLIKGLENQDLESFSITGGMCGDGSRFEKTLAGFNEIKEGEVVVIGFYGESLEISFASYGGWIPFGPERMITKSDKNILHELDGQPALDLYSKYLGDKASELPQASLLYPLYVWEEGKKHPVVRTILNIDRENQTMILAGDVPQGAKVQLMMASADALLEGAREAAKLAMKSRRSSPDLALLVSCIGRRLVLDQRAEEEIEEVIDIVGKKVNIGGFYSYGEIAPFHGETTGSLHNQTMTLTLISE
ncbi:FIST signal transduction protein [Christiangramia echinicola]|uniref:FIST signal transduction protein n=1 Tax=Christiangramia echinicola TaxID=279359 RepID=UPI000413F2FB|nr:FIST N-terminal domain-containing protein [Christiangramia echinicola]